MGLVRVGEPAPDFELSDQSGNIVKRSDFAGRYLVIFFYPMAMTPGCTVQARGVTNHLDDYESANASVVGISADPPSRLDTFRMTCGLHSTLLSDPTHETARSYGAWSGAKFFKPGQLATSRSTFIIDPQGKVAHVIKNVKPWSHDREVLDALAQLQRASV